MAGQMDMRDQIAQAILTQQGRPTPNLEDRRREKPSWRPLDAPPATFEERYPTSSIIWPLTPLGKSLGGDWLDRRAEPDKESGW